jgi:hypothetical protein
MQLARRPRREPRDLFIKFVRKFEIRKDATMMRWWLVLQAELLLGLLLLPDPLLSIQVGPQNKHHDSH